MWRIIHQFGSPPWVYRFCDRVIPWLLPLTAVALIVGSAWGLLFAPTDYKQGDSYRIIYIHVPAAVVSLAGYYIMAFAGLVSLVWRIKLADLAMRAAAPIGAAFTAVALITGAISNNSRIAEQAAQLLGGRIGGYIEVFGALAQQQVADAAAHEIALKACVFQFSQDTQRVVGDVSARDRVVVAGDYGGLLKAGW